MRFAHLVPQGERVLDLACGSGRHTSLFASLGYLVTALDRDVSQLGSVANLAEVEPLSFDLEGGQAWPFSAGSFGAIIVTNYLHRPVLPNLTASLRPNGVLLYETFAEGNAQFGKPSNPNFLLKPGELLDAVAGQLIVVAYEHGAVKQPRDAVVQRICARRAEFPSELQPR